MGRIVYLPVMRDPHAVAEIGRISPVITTYCQIDLGHFIADSSCLAGPVKFLFRLFKDIFWNALEATTGADMLEHAEVACAAAAAAISVCIPSQYFLEFGAGCRVPSRGVVVVIPTVDLLTREIVAMIHICLPI